MACLLNKPPGQSIQGTGELADNWQVAHLVHPSLPSHPPPKTKKRRWLSHQFLPLIDIQSDKITAMLVLIGYIIAFGCIGLFVWCIYDPAEFSIAMTALAIMPEWLAIVIGQVILLYMGGRMLNDWRVGKGANAEQVRQVLALQNEVRAVKEQMRPEPKAHELAEEDYAAEIADTSKPMSNAAIERWNKLRHKN